MQIARVILAVFGFLLLLVAVAFLWGMTPLEWLNGYLIGAFLLGYSVALLWIAVTQTYRALVGTCLGLLITCVGAVYALVQSQDTYWLGKSYLYAAFFALWFFFLGLKVSKKNLDRLPVSTQYLFALVFTASLLEGMCLVLQLPNHFIWVLPQGMSLVYGWGLIGFALFFGWGLLKPVWEHGYPQLYALVIFDLVAIGPILSLFQDVSQLEQPTSHLWLAICAISITGIWGIIELGKRLVWGRRQNLPRS